MKPMYDMEASIMPWKMIQTPMNMQIPIDMNNMSMQMCMTMQMNTMTMMDKMSKE